MTAARRTAVGKATQTVEHGLLEDSDDAIVAADFRGVLTAWNLGAERMYGWSAEEVLGHPVTQVAELGLGLEAGAPIRVALDAAGRWRGEVVAHRKDGAPIDVEQADHVVRDGDGEIAGYVGIHRDVTGRTADEVERERGTHRLEALAAFGLRALAERDQRPLMDAATAVVTRTLDAELGGVAELLPSGEVLFRSGVGWDPDAFGFAAGGDSLVDYTLTTGTPVVSDDVTADPRFALPRLLADHGVASAVAAIIGGRDGPAGVLGAYSRRPHRFTGADAGFVQSVAGVLGTARQRFDSEEELRDGDMAAHIAPRGRGPAREVRVLVVDHQTAVREALATAFAATGGFRMNGTAASLAQGREMLAGVDVAVLAIKLPDGSGADLIEDLLRHNHDARAIVVGSSLGHAEVARAVELGAAAVLHETASLEEIVGAARRLHAGETLVPLAEVVELHRFARRERDRGQRERARIAELTPREREVLQLLADGLSAEGIAARLVISPSTQHPRQAGRPLPAAGGGLRPAQRGRRPAPSRHRGRWSGGGCRVGTLRRPRPYAGGFSATTSSCSIVGSSKSSPVFSLSAAATSPERCAWRPSSSGKASKIPKEEGPNWTANHLTVLGSPSTIDSPWFRKSRTSSSLPGSASRRTRTALLTWVGILGFSFGRLASSRTIAATLASYI
jgi:PAS domain S-box-containing protein